jgi:uncharacterized protein YeaO (DUF488 family)
MQTIIMTKRVYDNPAPSDGCRVLVDRLWPRGLTKASAALTEWAKDLAPSDGLRKWFSHQPALWPDFQKRYLAELAVNTAVDLFIQTHTGQIITLLYAAHDTEHTHALVLQGFLQRKLEKREKQIKKGKK